MTADTTLRASWPRGVISAVLVATLLAGGTAIDNLPDHSAEHAQAQDLQLAINQAVERGRFEQAAQQICGPQAAWAELADGSVQCRTKHGRPTITVQVAP